MSITSEIDIPEPDSCMEKCLMKTLSVISYMSTMRDPYTAHHQKRVAMLSFAIAKKLKLGKQLSTGIYLGALIHDIGKIKVPAEILSFPDKLSLEQYNLIKKHPSDGEKIIHDIEFPWPIRDIVLSHHEHINGTGYPNGLKGNEISLAVRIVTVADVVEAMSSHRPYRPAKSIDDAIYHIEEHADSFYDAKVVEACINIFKDDNFNYVFKDGDTI
jgi:putative nucleotidyltransferase with HDIG domain